MPEVGQSQSRPVWERMEAESARAYAAFAIYRDAGVFERSIKLVQEQIGLKTPRHLQKLSVRFSWVERATAYDSYLDAKNRVENEADHSEQLEAFRAEQLKSSRRSFEIAGLMYDVAEEELKRVRTRQIAKKRGDEGVEMPKGLASLVRAAAFVATAGSQAKANALGVEKLLKLLDDGEGDQA